MAGVPVGDRLERMPGPKQQIFRQMLSDQLETNRYATLVETDLGSIRRIPIHVGARRAVYVTYGGWQMTPCATWVVIFMDGLRLSANRSTTS